MKNKSKYFLLALAVVFGLLSFVYAEDGARGIISGYVEDSEAIVPAGAYTTFSTVYNGKRWYLGIDTVQAKLGKDTLHAYDRPCYAAMWVAGGLYSPTGGVLADKNYLRTVRSLWIEERCRTLRVEGENLRYLALGADRVTYTPVVLTDTAHATLWYIGKDNTVQNKYIQGFLYDRNDATGVDVFRYLTYDPLYGFSRAYEAKPEYSQRISVWDRTTGSALVSDITPDNYTFGYNQTGDTVKQPFAMRLFFYEDQDHFRSRFDRAEVYARRSAPVSDLAVLSQPPYNMSCLLEWKSNQVDNEHPETYNGNSAMPYYAVTYDISNPLNPVAVSSWRDSVVMHVKQGNSKSEANVLYDTVYAIGRPPVDNPMGSRFLAKPDGGGAPAEGDYVDGSDWLYVHFSCKGHEYTDSVYMVRRTFHNAPYTTLSLASEPHDWSFPYTAGGQLADGTPLTDADLEHIFTVSARYKVGNKVLNSTNTVVSSSVGEEQVLDVAGTPCRRDTLWVLDGNGDIMLDGGGNPMYSDIVLYDTILVQALNMDGTPCDWVESVSLPARNRIKVRVRQYNAEALANRTAQIHYRYRYWRAGVQAVDEHIIQITQEWSGAHASDMYSFTHRDTEVDGLQAVHEKRNTVYAIPGEPLSLPLHNDLWGYYRWFIFSGADKDRDLHYGNTWQWVTPPVNNNDGDFMLINTSSARTSRGRWDVMKDVNAPSNPRFAADHFRQWTATAVPAVHYPENTAESLTKSGTVACDVSEYYDVEADDAIGSQSSVTEPVLGYRHVFDIKPAKMRADTMAKYVGNGSGANWMEVHNVVAPASREFKLQPQNPIAYMGAEEIDEEHLQYIYYANPTAANVGTRDGLTDAQLQENQYYARIGKKKTISHKYKLNLLTYSALTGMANNESKRVIIVNPRNGTGFLLGKGNTASPATLPLPAGGTTKDNLKQVIEDKLNDGGTYNSYLLDINRTYVKQLFTTDDYYRISSDGVNLYNVTEYRINGEWFGKDVVWGSVSGSYGDSKWNIDQYNYTSYSSNLPTGFSNGDLVSFWFPSPSRLLLPNLYGYMTYKDDYSIYCKNGISQNSGNNNAYMAWLVYEVTETDERNYEETPQWEIFNGSAWTRVAHWNYAANGGQGASVTDVSGHTMGADGSLQISSTVHTAVNETIRYRLRTEHFQLARFTIITRSADDEILRNGDIISEEDMERDYDIIYHLDMETWPAPNTHDVAAYNYHFPWDFTEMAHHLPLSAVSADKRVFGSEMPGKGEYAFINKFVVPAGNNNAGEEFECLAGAANGYMLCVNAGQKRTTIMNFEYDQLSCSGQQIYLVGNYCNPVQNDYDPQITADLEGTNDGISWTPLYRYKSGKIPYNHNNPWYQMALPIDRDHIRGFRKFRCRAEIDGAPNRDAHLLIDRLRFIERARGFSVFQNKISCMRDNYVNMLIRIDYLEDPQLYRPGRLVAFQLQKWDDSANGGNGAYVPVLASTNNGNGTYTQLSESATEIYPGYIKDAFTAQESVETPSLKSLTGNDYGYVMVPEAAYNPANSHVAPSALRSALIDAALLKLGITGGAADARKTAFLDERNNIRTFSEVVDYGDMDFGGYATPHIKSFVNEGTEENPYWVLYVSCRLPVSATGNNTFRIGMTLMNSLDDTPTFTEESCSTFRIARVKQATALRVDGAEWTNHTREQIAADDETTDQLQLLAANEAYRASVALQVDPVVLGKATRNPRCRFDLLHAAADVRYTGKSAADDAFLAKYGCTRAEFVDAMDVFRNDDDRNTVRNESDWTKVHPADFTNTGRSLENATEIYNRLNRLVTDGLLELGLDYRDIYMTDRADCYFYLIPMPATGSYDLVLGNHNGTADTTLHTSVCNDTLWLELHSEVPSAKLRYGYDNSIGDTYVLPVIRASRTDANSALRVRVAEIWTQSETDTVVLGWNATELIESNDPEWAETKVFRYCQDKDMRTHIPNETDYYGKGGVITFTPQAEGNTITLKAGCRYMFRTPFYSVLKSEACPETESLTPVGHAEFVLAVAPDTVRWTPAHPDRANYWNDDANWTAVVNGIDRPDVAARVPMSDTHVIIPQVAEGLLPIVSDIVTARRDTVEFGYAKNTCSNILFRPRSQMLGQEKLDYGKAFVDVQLTSGNWQTFSPALNHIYAGDMYVPANPETADASLFAPGTFSQGEGSSWASNPRVWPYAVYQGFYNASVPVDFYNTDYDGTPVYSNTAQSKNSVDWVKTNKLDMPYRPGAACVLNIYGPSDEDGEDIIIRLPKQEASYRGYGKAPGGSGYIAGPAVPMGGGEPFAARPAFGSLEHNLAYDKTALGAADGISYTLTNEIASDIFFFGNPTMSLVDVYTLCRDNEAVLQHEDGTYRFTAYQLIDGDSYTVKSITGEGQYFIAPQRAVGLIAKEPCNSLTIKLKPGAMVALTGDGTIVSSSDVASGAPVRRVAAAETAPAGRLLHIAAAVETTDRWGYTSVSRSYLTLGEAENAHDGFVKGEDAPGIASGLNYYSDESFSTPLSIYTVAGNQALMLDVRRQISGVPLVFTKLDGDYSFAPHTLLSFAVEGDEGEPFYLCDAVSGDSIRIVNGMQTAVLTPQSDMLRYYINGCHSQAAGEHGTATGVEVPASGSLAGDGACNTAAVYDMLGRCMLKLGENDLIDRTVLSAGVYLVCRGGETEKIVIK